MHARRHAHTHVVHADTRAHAHATNENRLWKVERARRAMRSARLWDTAPHQGQQAQEINMQGFEALGARNTVHRVGGIGQNS